MDLRTRISPSNEESVPLPFGSCVVCIGGDGAFEVLREVGRARADGVKGGFEPEHLLHCGVRSYQSADMILVQFSHLGHTNATRALLASLQALPHRPLVMAIQHCQLGQVLVSAAFRVACIEVTQSKVTRSAAQECSSGTTATVMACHRHFELRLRT